MKDTESIVDPLTGGRLCTCGLFYPPPAAIHAVRQCERQHLPRRTPAVPTVPGDVLRHSNYVTGRHDTHPRTYRPRSVWARVWTLIVFLAVLAAAGVLLGLAVLAAMTRDTGPAAPYRPGFVTPATYGPPGPSGGPHP